METRRSGEGGKHGDAGLDDGWVVGSERRDDDVEHVGAVVLRRVLPQRRGGCEEMARQGGGVCALPDSSKGRRDAAREMRCRLKCGSVLRTPAVWSGPLWAVARAVARVFEAKSTRGLAG